MVCVTGAGARARRLVARQAPPLPWLLRPRHRHISLLLSLAVADPLGQRPRHCRENPIPFLPLCVSGDEKTEHLKRLPSASDPEGGLRLFRADLLDYDAMAAGVAGCQGVFQVATPVPSGNLTDPEDWYSVAKITSEEVALEYGRQIGLDVVTINPALVLGPLLQPMCNTSCQFLIYFLKGGADRMRDKLWHIVGVRGVADALLLLYEAPGASGRHICAPHFVSARDLLRLLKRMYPG